MIIETIKELSSEGIKNVIQDQADVSIIKDDTSRKDLETLAQSLVDTDQVDEIYFIIELDSE